MLQLFIGTVVAALVWIVATVIFGYPALIIGALVGVAAMFAFVIALTAGGLFASKSGSAGH